VYEELLTQAEIQGNINKVNSRYHAKVIVLIQSLKIVPVFLLAFCNAKKSGRQLPHFLWVFLVFFFFLLVINI